MEKPSLFSSENYTFNSDPKYGNNKPIKAKSITTLVLVISLPILYVSLLHIPPSNLFKDTTFWFLMSNSIIIFIAVDMGTLFAPSHDIYEKKLYEDLVAYRKPRSMYFMEEPLRTIDKSLVVKEKLLDDSASTQDAHYHAEVTSNEEPDKALVVKNSDRRKVMKAKSLDAIALNQRRSLVPGEKPLHRSVTQEKKSCCNENESRDYEKLSDEELNRRVDEFIRRYYREMRLQLTNESG